MSEVLYTPSDERVGGCGLTRYRRWLAETRGLDFGTYDDLWAWSVADLDAFWASLWDWFEIRASSPYDRVLGRRAMPGAEWFPGAELNYAEHAFRRPDDETAVLFRSEHRQPEQITFGDLRRRTAEVAAGLRRLGVGKGDRVVAYAPNLPETLVAFLATASLGAVWSSCSPDFGVTAVLDRFRQVEPKVLVAVDGHVFKGAGHDRRDVVRRLAAGLPTVEATVTIPEIGLGGDLTLDDVAVTGAPFDPVAVPFDHPLWVLYSSGTTGLPKALVHGHGGILLEHLKSYALHMDAGPGDRFFWYSSTGWMMWNLLVSGLVAGACIVLYDGSPASPDLGALWRMAGEAGVTWFGASAPYLQACAKAGVVPRGEADLSGLRAVGSTGAPLPPEGFRWVYENVKDDDLMLGSVSGGTDVCSAFVGPCPVLPVRAGEIQCRCLGVDVAAYDPAGRSVVGEMGELVVRQPMPSMPLRFWGDEGDRRYREAYFSMFPGVWRHGDWVTFNERGSCVIAGRSDATLNRAGVRIGTAELYRVVEAVDGVEDSLVVDAARSGPNTSGTRMYLFIVLASSSSLDDALRAEIAARLRTELSPRHVPDEIIAVPEVPRTLNGKKVEVPVKRLLQGEAPEAVISPEGLANPAALEPFVDLARSLR